MRPVHLQILGRIACIRIKPLLYKYRTKKIKKVTCKNCKRTVAYRNRNA